MGYRYPEAEGEDSFDAQFEWDGNAWLFRRYRRARPVRIAPDERDRIAETYKRRSQTAFQITLTLSLVALVSWFLWAPDRDANDDPSLFAIALTVVALAWLGRRWAWHSATLGFDRRVPVGPERSWSEVRRETLQSLDWGDVLFPFLGAGFIASMNWPPRTWGDWYEFTAAAVVAGSSLLSIYFKWRSARS